MFLFILVLVLVLEFYSRLRERGRRRGGFSDIKPLPPACAEGVALGAEFNRAGRGAFKNVRHLADAPRILDSDLRDVFLERGDFSEHGHGAAGAAAGYFRSEEH